MFLGFGAIFVRSWQELREFPATPTRMTVREAAGLEEPARGAWIALTDVRFPCAQAEQQPTGTHYRLGFGASEDERIIVSGLRPCSDTPVSVVGVLRTASPGRIADLEFPGYDFAHWPSTWQSTLWTESGPDDARDTLILMPPFAFLGLVVLAFFWKPQPAPGPRLANLASTADATPWREGEKVLPERPLQLARSSLYDRLLTFLGLLVMGWLLLVLGWLSFSSVGGWLGGLGLVMFGGLGAALVLLALRVPAFWKRNTPLSGPRSEGLAPLLAHRPLLANGVDVGNLVVQFTHPRTGEAIERVIGAQASRPLVVDDHLFVVWGDQPNALMIIAEDFTPFELTPAEQRASLRQLIRWVATKR